MITRRSKVLASVVAVGILTAGASLAYVRASADRPVGLTSSPPVTVTVGAQDAAIVRSAGATVSAPRGALPEGGTGAFHCTRQFPFPASHDATSTSWLAWCREQPMRGYRTFTRIIIDDPDYDPSGLTMNVRGTVESSYRNDIGYDIWVLRATELG